MPVTILRNQRSRSIGISGHLQRNTHIGTFAAQWLACTLPYRRFADLLADACARLGADVVRYTFTVMDLHHLLLAGLPAHRIIAFITEVASSAALATDDTTCETIPGGLHLPAAAILEFECHQGA